jgi:hypothetical protein
MQSVTASHERQLKEYIMKHIWITLAIAGSVTAIGTAYAQQQFGRDSVYAVPGRSTRPPAGIVVTPINRFGRDSVYATQAPSAPSTPVSADAKSPQQYGRDSVYAYGSPNPPAATSGETRIGSTEHRHGG